MSGVLIKLVLIGGIFFIMIISMGLYQNFLKSELGLMGIILLFIVMGGGMAAIGAIWKYKANSNEIELNKDN